MMSNWKIGSAKNVVVACGLKLVDVDLLIYLVTAFAKFLSGVPTKGPY